jgi:hypothetical protein
MSNAFINTSLLSGGIAPCILILCVFVRRFQYLDCIAWNDIVEDLMIKNSWIEEGGQTVTLDLYPEGAWFDSRLAHLLS